MRHRTQLDLALAFLSLATSLAAQTSIPTDRLGEYARAGVTGGIPTRTTICATIAASTYDYGGTDAGTAIQAALDTCPTGRVVQLSEGLFTVNNLLLLHTPITLRGAGAGKTILQKTNGARPRLEPRTPIAPDSYTYDPQPVVIVGPQRYNTPDGATSTALTANGVKGATSVVVTSATGIAAGQIVLIDELSGGSWQATPTGFHDTALVWRGDRVAWNMHYPEQVFQDDAHSDATGPYQTLMPRTLPDAMSWFARQDRPIAEFKEVASVSGTTITFTEPLIITYRTSLTAQLTRYTGAAIHTRNGGVESLTLTGGADGELRFVNTTQSWATNVEVTQWVGEGVAIDASSHITIRDSYIHDGSWPTPGGGGYALSLSNSSTSVLIENNIWFNACKNMVFRASGAGSVVGYNFTDDAWDYNDPTWQEVGLNASHMATPHHVLFEGNYGQNFDSDYTHGNAIYMTVFRNHLAGTRRSFTGLGNARAAGLAYGSWWDSFVGNVLGTSGAMGAYNYEAPAMTSGSVWTGPNIWQIGYDPERFNDPLVADPDTMSTLIRDGNWDFKTNTQKFITTPAGFAMPNSLYLTTKPAFFGTAAWPWVNPATGGTTTLPAKARFDARTPNDTTPPGSTATGLAAICLNGLGCTSMNGR